MWTQGSFGTHGKTPDTSTTKLREGWKAYPGAVTHRTHPTHHTCIRKEKLKDFRDQKLEIKTAMESSSFPPGSRVPCTAVSAAPRARQSTGQSGIREQRHSRGHSAAPGRSPAPGTAGQGRRCFGICRRKQRPSQGNRRKNGNGPIAVSPFRPPFPGEGRTAGAERLGGSGGTGSQAASEWGPSPAGHPIPPGHREPFAAGAEPPLSLPSRGGPGGTHRLGGGGSQEEAEQQRGAQRDAGQRHGWAVPGHTERRTSGSDQSGLWPCPAAATAFIGPAQPAGAERRCPRLPGMPRPRSTPAGVCLYGQHRGLRTAPHRHRGWRRSAAGAGTLRG